MGLLLAPTAPLWDVDTQEGQGMDRLIRVSWHLHRDGGGEAIVHVDKKSEVVAGKYVFDSLDRTDQIPAAIAEAIREDGREQGELPRSDSD